MSRDSAETLFPELTRPLGLLLGESTASTELRRNLELVAGTDLSILLQGESGTGKGRIAQWIHSISPVAHREFVVMNCAAGSDLSSGMYRFGGQEPEVVNRAAGGTLFLENVDELPGAAQAALLRSLKDGYTVPDSAEGMVVPSARVISSTRRDLMHEADKSGLRPDFFYWISAFPVRIAPLRERVNEMDAMVSYILDEQGHKLNLSPAPLSRAAIELLQQYQWPGNLHELEEILTSYVLTGSEALLVERVSALRRTPMAFGDPGAESKVRGAAIAEGRPTVSLKKLTKSATEKLEHEIILKALQEHGWNRRETARWLQISYRSLLYKLKEIGATADPQTRRRIAMP